MNKIISLINMKSGETGRISQIQGGRGIAINMENMGIRIGSRIKKVSQQFMNGPVIIRAGNTQVGIGFGMANKVLVELE